MNGRPASPVQAAPEPFGARRHVLHLGDIACGVRGDQFETLLGSCIAVVMTDPRRSVGAMCHIVHCTPDGGGVRDSQFGDVALDLMYARLRRRGIEPRLCHAWVYGGGNMFPDLFRAVHVGQQNALWTLQALALDGVPVLHHDVGGNLYRRVRWTVGDGAPEVTAVAV